MQKKMIPKEYLGAFKCGHRKNVREYIDEELSWELLEKAEKGCEDSIAALRYLARFNNEYHKNYLKKGDPEALHRTKKQIKDCSDRCNSINRDTMAIVGQPALEGILVQASGEGGQLLSMFQDNPKIPRAYDTENTVCEVVDWQRFLVWLDQNQAV